MLSTRTPRTVRNAAAWTAALSCLCLVAFLPSGLAAQSVATSESTGTCSQSLNIGLDYFLRTKLFANLTQLDLPAAVPLPMGFRITRMKLAGLDSVSRGCSLELSPAGGTSLRLKACARAGRIAVSFVVQAVGYAVDFVQAALTDTSVSAQATVNLVPGGRIQLETFDLTLGGIDVENAGISGVLITRLMRLASVKELVRSAIVTQGGKKIEAELKNIRLPE